MYPLLIWGIHHHAKWPISRFCQAVSDGASVTLAILVFVGQIVLYSMGIMNISVIVLVNKYVCFYVWHDDEIKLLFFFLSRINLETTVMSEYDFCI